MLKRWSVTNFKPIRGRLDLDLAPVTLLAGLNSCGKSSFLQSILLIQQTLMNQNRERVLVFNGPLVFLETFDDVINARADVASIGVGFILAKHNHASGKLFSNTKLDVSFGKSNSMFDTEVLEGTLSLDWNVTDPFSFFYRSSKEEDSKFTVTNSKNSTPILTTKNHFLPTFGITSPDPNKNIFIPTFFQDEFRLNVRYIGPLRADPSTIHTSPTGEPDDVGKQGEHAAAVYEARKLLPVRWVPPGESESRENTLEEAMAAWLVYLGMAKGVASQEAARGFTWMVKTHGDKARPLFSVGVGVSQVLPILVAGLLAPEGAVLIIEQPELHLHPRAQARLGDFFVSLAHLGKQCLIETHSDTLVNQLRLHMVKGGEAVRELVSIYFVEQDEQGDARFEPVKVSEGGNIVNWPEGFLDESVKQEEAIAQEALRRRASRSRSSA